MQIISLIVATDKNGLIGKGKEIPWHLPADFAYFKERTRGHSVIMGNTTHEAIGKILPERKNVVLVKDTNYKPMEGTVVAHTPEDALALAGDGEVFIIGGGMIYRTYFSKADKIYLTLVSGDFEGDVFFPEIKKDEWKEISREKRKADEKNAHDMEWVVLERLK